MLHFRCTGDVPNAPNSKLLPELFGVRFSFSSLTLTLPFPYFYAHTVPSPSCSFSFSSRSHVPSRAMLRTLHIARSAMELEPVLAAPGGASTLVVSVPERGLGTSVGARESGIASAHGPSSTPAHRADSPRQPAHPHCARTCAAAVRSGTPPCSRGGTIALALRWNRWCGGGMWGGVRGRRVVDGVNVLLVVNASVRVNALGLMRLLPPELLIGGLESNVLIEGRVRASVGGVVRWKAM
jgi:hypothetical protein